MNPTTFILFVILATLTRADDLPPEEWESIPLASSLDPDELRRLRGLSQEVRRNGCPINLCFALQGGDYITDDEFRVQKEFAQIVTIIITAIRRSNFCAVQYATRNYEISELTRRTGRFFRRLDRADRAPGGERNVAAALGYTAFQLLPQERNPRKIIVMGDGQATLGFFPAFVSSSILNEDIGICAIPVGADQDAAALADITQSADRVIQLGDFFSLAGAIFEVVVDACGFQAPF